MLEPSADSVDLDTEAVVARFATGREIRFRVGESPFPFRPSITPETSWSAVYPQVVKGLARLRAQIDDWVGGY